MCYNFVLQILIFLTNQISLVARLCLLLMVSFLFTLCDCSTLSLSQSLSHIHKHIIEQCCRTVQYYFLSIVLLVSLDWLHVKLVNNCYYS